MRIFLAGFTLLVLTFGCRTLNSGSGLSNTRMSDRPLSDIEVGSEVSIDFKKLNLNFSSFLQDGSVKGTSVDNTRSYCHYEKKIGLPDIEQGRRGLDQFVTKVTSIETLASYQKGASAAWSTTKIQLDSFARIDCFAFGIDEVVTFGMFEKNVGDVVTFSKLSLAERTIKPDFPGLELTAKNVFAPQYQFEVMKKWASKPAPQTDQDSTLNTRVWTVLNGNFTDSASAIREGLPFCSVIQDDEHKVELAVGKKLSAFLLMTSVSKSEYMTSSNLSLHIASEDKKMGARISCSNYKSTDPVTYNQFQKNLDGVIGPVMVN